MFGNLTNLMFTVSLTDRVTKPLGGIMKTMNGIQSGALSGGLKIGTGTAGLYAVKSGFDMLTDKAIAFEKEMANVSKATNMPLGDTMRTLGDEVLKLGRTLPIAHEGLAQIMATGAKSNVPKESLTEYTNLVAKVSTAWETAAEETATDVAKLSNIFQIPILEMGRLTDAVNKLDDASSSAAPEIVDILKRSGGSAMAIKMSSLQTAALATTLLDLGETSEKAGTGINALLERIGSPKLQNKNFQATLQEIGWSAEKMEYAVKNSGAQTTILALFDTISKFDDQKKRDILGGLFGSEYADNLSKLANNLTLYQDRIRTVSNDQNYLNSVNAEFANRTQAAAYKLVLFNNRVDEMKIRFGGTFASIISDTFPDLFKSLDSMNDKFSSFAQENPMFVKAIGYAVVGLGALVGVLSLGAIAWGVFTLAMLPGLLPLVAFGVAVGVVWWAINRLSASLTLGLMNIRALGQGMLNVAGNFLYTIGVFGFIDSALARWEMLKAWWAGFRGWLASLDPFGALLGSINNVIARVQSIGAAIRGIAGGVSFGVGGGGAGGSAPRSILNKLQGGNSTKNVTVNVNNSGGGVSPAAIGHHLRMAGG